MVLDSNHYGCFEGSVWYRARFTAADGRDLVLRGNGGTGQPSQGRAPGISWYRATFDLDTADDVDTAWRLAVRSTRFEDDRTDPCQIVLYVNGWNVGVYIGDIGPQAEFTIPSGFPDHHGPNTLALWVAAKEAGACPQTVELVKVFDRTGSLGAVDPIV